MTIHELQKFGRERLYKHVFNPDLESDLLLAHVLNKDRIFLYSHPEKKISAATLQKFKKLILRRAAKEPFAYLVGETEFYGSRFKVTSDVLIPRPDTEILVKEALNLLANKKFKTVIDVGTGSGQILISIAAHQKAKNKLLGIDISPKALKVAGINSRRILKKDLTFVKGDLLRPLYKKLLPHPWLIVSNPPYLTTVETKKKELSFEPLVALTGGKRGLDLIEKMIRQYADLSRPGDFLLMEIGYNQGKKIERLVKKYLPLNRFEIKKDHAGFDRVVSIESR